MIIYPFVIDFLIHMRFIADNMLGKLAKWLRFLGYDVVYNKSLTDKELIELSCASDRFVLTRDKELTKRKKFSGLYIKSEALDDQFKQVITEFNLILDNREFTRCPECNSLLNDIDKSGLENKVPPGVFERQEKFWRCDTCGQYYWRGTHYEKIKRKLRQFFS